MAMFRPVKCVTVELSAMGFKIIFGPSITTPKECVEPEGVIAPEQEYLTTLGADLSN
jgi:hypothetical protein